MIGNSFSESVLVELPNVVKSTGDRLVLVNLMIGGCRLKRHWDNYLTSETNAAFRPYAIEIDYEGEKKVEKTPLAKFAPRRATPCSSTAICCRSLSSASARRRLRP